jgi:serine/threonine protein phosphatase PrpC
LVSSHYSNVPPPPRPAYRLEAFGLTDIGQVRQVNEDYFGLRPSAGLFTLADGMGGHAAGEVASRLAIECVCHALENPRDVWPAGGHPRARHPDPSLLEEALQLANRRLLVAASENARLKGMGTTFVGALFSPGRVAIAHVGDSRAYRLRGRRIEQLTEDHSLLNEYVRAGLFRPEDGCAFPYPSAITRALGTEAHFEVDVRLDATAPGDVYLLCSDGLSGVVAPWELAAILLEHHDLCRAAGRLIERANALGGPDNITAVLVRVGDSAG